MPGGGFDFRKRRSWIAWGARRQWPPLNPLGSDPAEYIYISSDHVVNPTPTDDCPDPNVQNKIIHSLGADALGLTGAWIPDSGTLGSGSWQTANGAFYVPFNILENTTAYQAFWYNGGTVSGNICVAILSETGTRLITTGSTAQATINVIQTVDWTDTALAPGNYWLGLAVDNTTSQFVLAGGMNKWTSSLCGVKAETSAFPIPSSANLSGHPTVSQMPIFGFYGETIV